MTHTANTQDEFGLRIAARLNSASLELPHDISERLRAARTRAVAARLKPQTRLQTSTAAIHQNGAALLNFGGDEGLNIWSRLASLLPLIALIAGLALIQTSWMMTVPTNWQKLTRPCSWTTSPQLPTLTQAFFNS